MPSIMLRQEEFSIIKTISTLQLSPAPLKELRMAVSRRVRSGSNIIGLNKSVPIYSRINKDLYIILQ